MTLASRKHDMTTLIRLALAALPMLHIGCSEISVADAAALIPVDVATSTVHAGTGETITTVDLTLNPANPDYDRCLALTATPVLVNGHVVFPVHYRRPTECDAGSYPGFRTSLLGYSLSDGRVWALSSSGGAAEATPLFDAATNRIYWPHGGGVPVTVLDGATFDTVGEVRADGPAAVDSSGTLTPSGYAFGTINVPQAPCNDATAGTEDYNCGAVFKADAASLDITHSLRYDSPLTDDPADGPSRFRNWIGGSVSSGGNQLYVGGTAQYGVLADGTVGPVTDEYRYGCSVILLDEQLRIQRSFDPGVPACNETKVLPGMATAAESAVAGEPVVVPDGVWVQYTVPNNPAPDPASNYAEVEVYRLSRDLDLQCTYAVPSTIARKLVSFYQAPTVDQLGRAYAVFTTPVDPDHEPGPSYGRLYRFDPPTAAGGCAMTELLSVPEQAQASPTLVDDRFALVAATGKLYVFDVQANAVHRVFDLAAPAGTPAAVYSAPVVIDGKIYVLAADGTLTIIEGTGMTGYGGALWPRFRRDNGGSGRADS
ncbi:MAG: hypothetical protein HYV63_30570 [Candidatus Schekmanbacteria bacterium]|nr:hypothetical protein [Candidatus Schekmanbacteria bacterium]